MHNLLSKKTTLLVLGYLGVVIFFILVNPNNLPFALTLLPFVFIFVLLFSSVWLFIDAVTTISSSAKRVIALVLSVMPILLLLMRSITQLTIKDVMLGALITVIIVWYSAKAQAVG